MIYSLAMFYNFVNLNLELCIKPNQMIEKPHV